MFRSQTSPVCAHAHTLFSSVKPDVFALPGQRIIRSTQPRPQRLLVFQYGGETDGVGRGPKGIMGKKIKNGSFASDLSLFTSLVTP